MSMMIQATLRDVAGIIRWHLGPETKIFLFGSWAEGKALPASDADVGILGKGKIPLETLAKIKEDIEAFPTLRGVDIVDLQSVEEDFKGRVLCTGHPL